MTRLDVELVDPGLARSRTAARGFIKAGAVTVDGVVAGKPSAAVPADAHIEVSARDEWVGRAAYKLLAALEAFPVDVAGRRCIDVGASTGGFTQVLLARGATGVEAVDVGHGHRGLAREQHG